MFTCTFWQYSSAKSWGQCAARNPFDTKLIRKSFPNFSYITFWAITISPNKTNCKKIKIKKKLVNFSIWKKNHGLRRWINFVFWNVRTKWSFRLTVFASRNSKDLSRTLYKQQFVAKASITKVWKPGTCILNIINNIKYHIKGIIQNECITFSSPYVLLHQSLISLINICTQA